MTSPYWPLAGLRVRTARLELRWPTLPDLDALAALAASGVHDPSVQPFGVPWTDAPPDERARSTLQYHWAQWGAWQPADWTLNLVVDAGGVIVGTQGMHARNFAVLREVNTGSWLGREYQGQGIGTQMRAAVLALAFDGLAAQYATSEAHSDNPASRAVSRRLGYADDGILRREVRGKPATAHRFRLDRATWQAHRFAPAEITGLEPCLPLFGLTS